VPFGTREFALAERRLQLTLTAQDQASAVLNRVGTAIDQTGRRAGMMGYQLFAASLVLNRVGAAFERAGRKLLDYSEDAIQLAADFDYSMRLVQTQAQLNEQAFARVSQRVLDMSSHFPQGAGQLAQGLYDIFSSMEVSSGEALQMLNLSAQAATAGGVEIRDSVRGVIQILNAFDLEIGDTRHVYDVLFQMLRKSTGTFEELVTGFGNVIGAGRMANQNIETLAGSVAFLTKQGRTQAQASISVSRALDQLTRSTNAEKLKNTLGVDIFDRATGDYKQLNEIIEEMAISLEGMSKKEVGKVMYDIFGAGSIQANRFFRLAIPQWKELNSNIDQMTKSRGQLEKAFDIMKQAPSVRLQTISHAFKMIAIQIGTFLIPALMRVVKWLRGLVDWFNDLNPEMKKFISYAIPVVGAILLIVGKAAQLAGVYLAFKSLITFMGIGSAAAVAAGEAFITWGAILKGAAFGLLKFLGIIGLVAAVAYLIYQNWDKIKPYIEQFWQWFQDVALPYLKGLWETIQDYAGKVWDWLVQQWEAAQPALQAAWDWVRTVAIPALQHLWDFIQEWAPKIWGYLQVAWAKVVETAKVVWEYITKYWRQWIVPFINWLKGIWSEVVGFIGEEWNKMAEWGREIWPDIQQAWANIQEAFRQAWQIIKPILEVLWDAIQEFVDIVQALWDRWGDEIMNAVRIAWNFIKSTISNVLRFLRGIIDIIVGIFSLKWSRIWEGVKNVFGAVWDQIVNFLSTALQLIGNLLSALWDGISALANSLWTWLSGVPGAIVRFFAGAAGWLFNAGKDILTGLWNGIVDAAEAVWTWFKELPGKLLDLNRDSLEWLKTSGKNILTGLWNGIVEAASAVWTWFTELPGKIGNFFVNAINWLWDSGKNILTGLWEGIKSVFVSVQTWFRGIPTLIKNFFNRAREWLVNAGEQVVKGFLDGLKAAWSSVTSWVSEHAGDVARIFGFAIQAFSPSKVMYALGEQTMEGYRLGLLRGWQGVQRQTRAFNLSMGIGLGSRRHPMLVGAPGEGERHEININVSERVRGKEIAEELDWFYKTRNLI